MACRLASSRRYRKKSCETSCQRKASKTKTSLSKVLSTTLSCSMPSKERSCRTSTRSSTIIICKRIGIHISTTCELSCSVRSLITLTIMTAHRSPRQTLATRKLRMSLHQEMLILSWKRCVSQLRQRMQICNCKKLRDKWAVVESKRKAKHC